MPDYTIETTYRMPVFRHGTYSATTPEAACRSAIDDGDWHKAKPDHESAGETYVTGIWQGADAAYFGTSIPVPSHFRETVQRQTEHFEILLGLLKMMVADARANRPTPPDWMAKAAWAIARGEAILAGTRDPAEPVDVPAPNHVLAMLREDRVRDAIAAVVKVDQSFKTLTPDAVTDEEIHTACLSVATTMDFSEVMSTAELRAALAALEEARRRLGV